MKKEKKRRKKKKKVASHHRAVVPRPHRGPNGQQPPRGWKRNSPLTWQRLSPKPRHADVLHWQGEEIAVDPEPRTEVR